MVLYGTLRRGIAISGFPFYSLLSILLGHGRHVLHSILWYGIAWRLYGIAPSAIVLEPHVLIRTDGTKLVTQPDGSVIETQYVIILFHLHLLFTNLQSQT